ncbi:MAG: sulfite exporter TauE/SafE family protein, partial [Gemmatimonadota bacterium]|nr:sulfite exporter TauE/SafE family protein [Gemmatimonadota bacterium]
AWATRRLGAALLAMRDRPPVARAAVTGLLTTLLPCGWLYTFVVTAGGTGGAVDGAGVMAVFWLGTVPILLAVGLGAQRLLGPVARRLPLASAAMVLVLGLLSISGRLRPPRMMHMAAHAPPAAVAMDSAHAAR